jgi:hypothetical protein
VADIFISYKREERRFAERLSIALEQLGFDVWWDFELLSGDRYRNVIRAVIDQCSAAIVLWSKLSVESDFVMDEATYAKAQGKLCPTQLDAVEIPFGFGQIHTDDLRDWDGELSHPGFQALVRAVEGRVGRKGRLGAARHGAEVQAAGAELESFKAAQISNNASALRAFLKAHPRGMFAGFVRGQLETIEAMTPSGGGAHAPTPPAPPPPPTPHAEPYRFTPQPTPAPTPAPTPPKNAIGLVAGVVGLLIIGVIMFGPKKVIPTGISTEPGIDLPTQNIPAELASMDKNVRDAVLRARDSAQKATAWAANARAAAFRAKASGVVGPKDGEGVWNYNGDRQGDVYAGQFKNSDLDGVGVLSYADNANSKKYNLLRYEGGYTAGNKNGYGVMLWNDGDSYTGDEKTARMTGFGVYRFADGRRYEGEWLDDTENGYGALWDAQGKLSKAGVWTKNELTTPLGPQGN